MKGAKENRKAAKNPDLLIAGGGLAGLALAAILGRAGAMVDVVDPSPAPEPLKGLIPSGRTVALMESSLNILRAAGIGDVLERFGCPLEVMRIIDDSRAQDEPIVRDFEANDIGMARFGMNVPNNILRSALFEAVKGLPNVRLHTGRSVNSYQPNTQNVRIELDNGYEIFAKLPGRTGAGLSSALSPGSKHTRLSTGRAQLPASSIIHAAIAIPRPSFTGREGRLPSYR